jgi:hypothetical protein
MANRLRGEERRVISTKLYRSEFVNLMKICEAEDKSIHQKLRELVQKEVNEKLGGVLKDG